MIVLLIVLGSGMLSFAQEYRASTALEKLRAKVRITCAVLPRRKNCGNIEPQCRPRRHCPVVGRESDIRPTACCLTPKISLFRRPCSLASRSRRKRCQAFARSAATVAERTNCAFMGTSVRNGTARMLVINTGAEHGIWRHRRPPSPAPAGDGIRARRAPLRISSHAVDAAARAGGVCRQYPAAPGAHKVALVRHRLGSWPVAGTVARYHQHHLVPGRTTNGRAWGHRPPPQRHRESRQHGRALFGQDGHADRGRAELDARSRLCRPTIGRRRSTLPASMRRCRPVLPIRWTRRLSPEGSATASILRPIARLDEIPYDFVRKRLSVLVQGLGAADDALLITKGALTSVLQLCAAVQSAGGQSLPLEGQAPDQITELFTAL